MSVEIEACRHLKNERGDRHTIKVRCDESKSNGGANLKRTTSQNLDVVILTAFGAYAYILATLSALTIKQAGEAMADGIGDALGPVAQNDEGITASKAFDDDGMQKTAAPPAAA